MASSSYPLPPIEAHEFYVAIYEALSDLERGVRLAGAKTSYTPPSSAPLARLARMLGLPEHKQWEPGGR